MDEDSALAGQAGGEEPGRTYVPLQWTAGDEPNQDDHVREYREYEAFRHRDFTRDAEAASNMMQALNALNALAFTRSHPKPSFWASLLGSSPF